MQTSAEVSVSQIPFHVLIDHADISRGVSVTNTVLRSDWPCRHQARCQCHKYHFMFWSTMQTSAEVSVSQMPFYVILSDWPCRHQTRCQCRKFRVIFYSLTDHAEIRRGVNVRNTMLCSIVYLTLQTYCVVFYSLNDHANISKQYIYVSVTKYRVVFYCCRSVK